MFILFSSAVLTLSYKWPFCSSQEFLWNDICCIVCILFSWDFPIIRWLFFWSLMSSHTLSYYPFLFQYCFYNFSCDFSTTIFTTCQSYSTFFSVLYIVAFLVALDYFFIVTFFIISNIVFSFILDLGGEFLFQFRY